MVSKRHSPGPRAGRGTDAVAAAHTAWVPAPWEGFQEKCGVEKPQPRPAQTPGPSGLPPQGWHKSHWVPHMSPLLWGGCLGDLYHNWGLSFFRPQASQTWSRVPQSLTTSRSRWVSCCPTAPLARLQLYLCKHMCPHLHFCVTDVSRLRFPSPATHGPGGTTQPLAT